MSSSIMHKSVAISIKNVSKSYTLYGSQANQLLDILGLKRFVSKTNLSSKSFSALDDVSLEVPRGKRIGIIGRNGAGKTTLLKLICGNYAPSLGSIEVNGTVQALMNVGTGFHPEYTGRENAEASLQYNGLNVDEYTAAMDGIIEFCELGEFIDQPLKTYSMGMQARLMFAAATAINPDILIVDEVLGAGDAYFIAKSKIRVEKLVASGCTLLLVSHSMQQVLELCEEVIWMESGRIRMQGTAFDVVKAYEQHLHGPISSIIPTPVACDNETDKSEINLPANDSFNHKSNTVTATDIILQEPFFRPHHHSNNFLEPPVVSYNFETNGGISRWESVEGLKIIGFSIITENGLTNKVYSMRPVEFIIDLICELDAEFSCRYGIAINDYMGNCITRIFSPKDEFFAKTGGRRRIGLQLNPCQLGPGNYTIGISVLDYQSIELLNASKRYDLLSRSFELCVELPDSLAAISANFFHSGEWKFN